MSVFTEFLYFSYNVIYIVSVRLYLHPSPPKNLKFTPHHNKALFKLHITISL